jgi:hypothetical protein
MAYTRHTPWPDEDGTFPDHDEDRRLPRAIRAIRRERRAREHAEWRARNPELAAMTDDFNRTLLRLTHPFVNRVTQPARTVEWSLADARYTPVWRAER